MSAKREPEPPLRVTVCYSETPISDEELRRRLQRIGRRLETMRRARLGLPPSPIRFEPPPVQPEPWGPRPLPPEPVIHRPPPRETVPGVYLLQDPRGFYKIGCSSDTAARTAKQTGKGKYPARLIHVVRAEEPYKAERWFHERFAEERIVSEWFTMTEEEVAWFCSLASWPLAAEEERREPR